MKNWAFQMAAYLLIAILFTAGFGYVLSEYFEGKTPLEMAFHALGAAGGGWVILLIIARAKLENWKAYLPGTGKIMSMGVLVLIPSILLINNDFHPIWLPIVNVAISFSLMLYMNIKLCNTQEMSQHWTLIWALSLATVSTLWITTFLIL
jgi:hypothetical protein